MGGIKRCLRVNFGEENSALRGTVHGAGRNRKVVRLKHQLKNSASPARSFSLARAQKRAILSTSWGKDQYPKAAAKYSNLYVRAHKNGTRRRISGSAGFQ